ncbi:MAG: flagellar hook-basal body complex protein FliE [Lachnospiraceae bacterium]|nr:flagellar hook-basal body complex protein FliE [Lachnospiraceae bacterium]
MVDTSLGISSVIQDIQAQRSSMTSMGRTTTDRAENTFSAIFDQMVNLVGETDSLAAEAEKAEIDFSLGNADSTHEVTVAQQKALVSLQYTVAVKNALMEAYQEIMNIQI